MLRRTYKSYPNGVKDFKPVITQKEPEVDYNDPDRIFQVKEYEKPPLSHGPRSSSETRAELIKDIHRFLKFWNMKQSMFGLRCCNRGELLRELERGVAVRETTVEKAYIFMRKYRPSPRGVKDW